MDSSIETPTENGSSPESAPEILFTEEQIAEHAQMLRTAIDLGLEWFEEAKDAEAFEAMTLKEQRFSQLLDPLIWSMREALITYEHEDCEECKVRRETGGNGYGLAVADMLLGGKVDA